MTIKAVDFVPLYTTLGATKYEQIPHLLEIARAKHLDGFDHRKNFEQSWRVVKGGGLERVIAFILRQQLEELDLDLVPVKEAGKLLEIDFGPYGSHKPDVDLIVYQQGLNRVLAILSIKTSLRERATQTAYWRTKIRNDPRTQNVRVFLVTPNSDDILRNNRLPNKQRAILETDIDATYIVNTAEWTLENYLYKGKPSRIRLIADLANDLRELMHYRS